MVQTAWPWLQKNWELGERLKQPHNMVHFKPTRPVQCMHVIVDYPLENTIETWPFLHKH